MDGDATAADRDHSQANIDHSRDQDAARDTALAKTIPEAVALQTQSITEIFAKQKSEETQSIAEAVAGALAKIRQKRHSLSQKHSQGKWRRHMCNTRSFSRKVVQLPYQLPLKSLLQQMDLE